MSKRWLSPRVLGGLTVVAGLVVSLTATADVHPCDGRTNWPGITVAQGFPCWWASAQGWEGGQDPFEDPFTSQRYERTIGSVPTGEDGPYADAEAYLVKIQKLNKGGGGSKKDNIKTARLPDGSLLTWREGYYYFVRDKNGQLVSLFVRGEESGVFPLKYPDGSVQDYRGDDLLCFFQGSLGGRCAISDDT